MAGIEHPGEMPERPAAAQQVIDSHAGIFRRLADDHAQVASLMQQVIATPDEAVRESLFEDVRRELLSHARAEQNTFYEALRDHATTREFAVHAWEEHEEVEQLLTELEGEDTSDDAWMDTFVQMMTAVEHHVSAEEGEMFAQAKNVLSKQDARELEERFAVAKDEEFDRLEE